MYRIALVTLFALPIAGFAADDSFKDLTKEAEDFVAKYKGRAPDNKALASKFLQWAEKNSAEPEAAEALAWTMALTRLSAEEDKAAELLIKDHMKSTKLADAAKRIPNGPWTPAREKAARGIAEKAADKDAQGYGAIRLMQQLRQRTILAVEKKDTGTKPSFLLKPYEGSADAMASLEKSDIDKIVTEADDLAKKIKDNHAKLPIGGNYTVGELSTRVLLGLRNATNLAIGKEAPNFECMNIDGKKNKLSDYRGKVVVVDIWATWCPPCRAMIPHERELVKRLEKQPFTLISVSCDAEKDTLTKFIEKNEMPWVHWHNGAQGGMVDEWNVFSFPTIYVLDAKGVVRYKGVRGEAMDKAVDALLKEMEDKK